MNQNIYSPKSAISKEKQNLTFWDLFTLLFSFGVGLAVIQTGSIVALGVGSLAYSSIIVGSIIGTLFLSFIGTIGAKTGLSSMSSMSLFFGRKTSIIPTIFNIIQLIGWGSFEIIIIRESMIFLFQHYGIGGIFASSNFWTLLVGFIAILFAMSGPLSIVRIFLKKIAIWLVLGACIWLTIFLFINPPHIKEISTNMSFFTGCDLVISMAFSFLPVICDYTRFAKNTRVSFKGVLFGFSIANAWLMLLGAAYTLNYTQSSETNALLLHLATIACGIPLLFILFNETDNIFIDIHSSSISLALFLKIPIKILSCIIGFICISIALWVPLSRYTDFLLGIGSIFAPLFGVVLTEYLLILKGKDIKSINKQYSLYSWVIGIIAFQLCNFSEFFLGAAIPSLFVAAILQFILWKTQKKDL